jgi:type I restriction enzyme S subunit
MCDVLLPIPAIDEQRKIVAQYQAVESRIQANEDIIAKLEETAQTIYKRMFVDDIDSSNLPSGWKTGQLSDMGKIITGKTPSSDFPEDFGYEFPFITPGDFIENQKYMISTTRYLSNEGFSKLKLKALAYGDIAVTCIGYVGKVSVVAEPSISNQQINSIRVNQSFLTEYLYMYLKSITQVLVNAAVGSSTLPLLNKTDFEKIPIILPDETTLKEYSSKVSSISRETLLKQKENNKLTEMLNILLYRLSSR